MEINFTKMQGCGNDFVVLDETQGDLGLSRQHYRWLADRHFGVGADQILTVRPARQPDVDFAYVIHNADGGEVEHCGNGARCFLRFVHERGLTCKNTLRVQTRNRLLELHQQADGRVSVDMGLPEFALDRVPFDAAGLGSCPSPDHSWQEWLLAPVGAALDAPVSIAVLSLGNPHAVLRVEALAAAPVEQLGALIERHPRFAERVNVGFMQVHRRDRIGLRVFERGVGETLACGTGACAAVVAGIRLGWLDPRVDVQTQGGELSVAWAAAGASVWLTGPAQTVFEGRVRLPDFPAEPIFTEPPR